MENVIQVVSKKNIEHFKIWRKMLEDLGYQSFVKNMTATNYGIPQTRNRTFMISLLGDYNYNFPKEMKLDCYLKDIIEYEVDDYFFLSDKMIDYVLGKNNNGEFPRKERFMCALKKANDENIGSTICTTNDRPTDNFILVPEATKKGWAKAEFGDGVYIDRPYQKRGVVQKGMIQTIKTSGNDVGIVTENLFIRKLTPKEAFKLMGVKEEDFNKIEKNQLMSSLYHLAGDSIVTTCLMAIFGKLLGLDYETKIKELVNNLKGAKA